MVTYAAYYITSSGQPQNGYQEYTSKAAAIAQARRYRDNLISRGGGEAIAINIDDYARDGSLLYDWYEHAGGGYSATV